MLARSSGVDVFHSTSYRGVFAQGMQTVLTIHDMAYHEVPEMFTPGSLKYYRHLPQHAARAQRIVTVSEYTKRDVTTILGVPSEKVAVIYNGIDLDRFRADQPLQDVAEVRLRYSLSGKTVLAVGNMNPKKNIRRLLAAMRYVVKSVPEAQLVLVGKETWYGRALCETIESWGLHGRVRFTGYVPDEDLPLLYRAADVFVFPSLFEGFGIPLLEAMACGTPVVASNVTSLPEVVGEAGLLVDPRDEEAMANGVIRALSDRPLRQQLIECGLHRVRQFSWENAAKAAVTVYCQAYHASCRKVCRGNL